MLCGICRAVTTNGNRLDEPTLRRMTGVMSHRRPDESGHCLRDGEDMGDVPGR
jgi:asparagine synthetase B (glutamine-hydrolysing)